MDAIDHLTKTVRYDFFLAAMGLLIGYFALSNKYILGNQEKEIEELRRRVEKRDLLKRLHKDKTEA